MISSSSSSMLIMSVPCIMFITIALLAPPAR